MHDLDHNEDRPRGTYEFPFEFHHIDHTHPRYVMSYHWHVEYEIIRILEGSLTVTLDEKSFTAKAGDVIFVNSGVLHSGIPQDCIYQCIVFDMNMFLKFNSICHKPLIQLVGMIAGTIVCYLFGTVWFCIVADSTFKAALGICVIPFIPADLIKMIIAMIIGPMIKKRIR